MLETASWIGAICTAEPALRGGLLLGLLAAGAIGSVVHCGPMCGVFVLGQVSDRMVRLPSNRLCEWQRYNNGLILPYHLGRLTTYATLGALAAGATGILGHAPWFSRISAILLILAALLFLAHAIERVSRFRSGLDRAPRRWSTLIGKATRLIPRGTLLGEYLLGVVLGFLPCGFLYAAIAAAAASANPAMGAIAMAAFGIGTTPMLLAIGVAGHAAGRRFGHATARFAPALMAMNGLLLLLLAWQRLA